MAAEESLMYLQSWSKALLLPLTLLLRTTATAAATTKHNNASDSTIPMPLDIDHKTNTEGRSI